MRLQAWGMVEFGLLCIVGLDACQWSSETSSGLMSMIRVEGGQATRGSIDEPPSAIEAKANIFPTNAMIFAGVSQKSIWGNVGPNTNAAALGIAGDPTYWRVPALNVDQANADLYVFTAGLSISPEIWQSPLLQKNGDGTLTLPLSVRAVDNSGNFGEAKVQPLFLDPPAITGTLAVSLEWDSAVDLDLHLLVPADNDVGYTEVWSKSRSAVVDSDPRMIDGTLDFDSNAGCQIDGRNRENIIWTGQPPVGHYVVRVAAASLCGLSSAAWYAYGSVPNASKGHASGVLTEAASRSSTGRCAGMTVLEFDFP
jgi:hypothetical protein